MPYVLFLDESGDHNLTNIDQNFPVFCLAGCIFERNYYKDVVRQKINAFKMHYWGRTDVILHSRDIRKHQGAFHFLNDNNKRIEFYEALNSIIAGLDFIIIAVIILKNEHYKNNGTNARHPYHLSLEFILERYSIIIDNGDSLNSGYITAESRGKQEDQLLIEEYYRLKKIGTRYMLLNNLSSFWMEKKEANITGLQIADLVAYPIAAKILRPSTEQKSFDILYPKLYTASSIKGHTRLGYGLKIFPQPTLEHYALFGPIKENEP